MAFLKLALVLAVAAVAVSASDNSTSRMIGGSSSDITANYFPWTVAVRHSQTLVGGGALITDRWVVTSGKVVSGYPGVNRFSVFLGGMDIWNTPEPGRIEIKCDMNIAHPSYKRDTHYANNIGLLRLETPTGLYPNIQPIKISTIPVRAGSTGIVAGWGGTSTVSRFRQWAYITTKDSAECVRSVGGKDVAGANICSRGSGAACWYDHGNPLATWNGVEYLLVGVTTYSGCLDPNNPTIYAALSHPSHVSFIKSYAGVP